MYPRITTTVEWSDTVGEGVLFKDVLGVPLLDHVVLGHPRHPSSLPFASLRERMHF